MKPTSKVTSSSRSKIEKPIMGWKDLCFERAWKATNQVQTSFRPYGYGELGTKEVNGKLGIVIKHSVGLLIESIKNYTKIIRKWHAKSLTDLKLKNQFWLNRFMDKRARKEPNQVQTSFRPNGYGESRKKEAIGNGNWRWFTNKRDRETNAGCKWRRE